MDDRYDAEVLRLAGVLATVVRTTGRTRQSVERELGLSSGYLSKILGGTVDLRARHILAVVEAVGFDPGTFFALAFPPRKPETSEEEQLVESTRLALGQGPSGDKTGTAEFDAKVKASLIRLLGLPEAPQPQ